MAEKNLKELSKLIRYWILLSTNRAGSGHVTSSFSAVELMSTLFFGGFYKYDLKNPKNPNNDRLIFSKGHASPLFYSLYAVANAIKDKELENFRKFESDLEGHPTPRFPYAEVCTGSLGQGLSVGVGMALNGKYLDKLNYKTYVLLGDSEMTEGSCWEAIESAAFYKLDNLVAVLDVNRLGQRGETMLGHNIKQYQKRVEAFGWQTVLVKDGHSLSEIAKAFVKAVKTKGKPVMIIGKTVKGKGISFLEDKNGWHGKVLKGDEFAKALKELGNIDFDIRGVLESPKTSNASTVQPVEPLKKPENLPDFKLGDKVATRYAYGVSLAKLAEKNQKIVALDAEVSNSTHSEIFKENYSKRFFEMFIAEQNMAGVALGFSAMGKIPFVSTFAAFFARSADQIRMAQYSREKANIKFIGSHAGVSIGEDGPSQMGLEDIAFFRTIRNSCVLYPADAVSAEKLVREMAEYKGISYLRATRAETPVIYSTKEEFPIGKSKIIKKSDKDIITLVASGITLFEALKAYEILSKENIFVRVVDLYSIKPIDKETLLSSAKETKAILTVEDHYLEGGIGEAVASCLSAQNTPVYSLAVNKIPVSGKPEELLDFEEISAKTIVKKVKEILN